MSHFLKKGRTLSEKQILSYAYHVEQYKIPFWMYAPAASLHY